MTIDVPELFAALQRDEQAATAVEYAIMLVFVVLIVIVTVGVLGKKTANSFNKFVTTFNPGS